MPASVSPGQFAAFIEAGQRHDEAGGVFCPTKLKIKKTAVNEIKVVIDLRFSGLAQDSAR